MSKIFESMFQSLNMRLLDQHKNWAVANLTMAGEGVDFVVIKGVSKTFGPVVFRIPKTSWISHLNDPLVEARQLLQQESIIASYLAAHGIPTPQVYALCIEEDSFDFLMSAYIDSDGGIPNVYQLGMLMQSIHALPPPSIRLAMQTHTTAVDSITERMLRRSHLIEKIFGVTLPIPEITKIVESMRAHYRPAKLLHMDVRAPNLLANQGDIYSIIDWGNALIGDPAFELARIAEYGYVAQRGLFSEYGYGEGDGQLDKDFAAGYGSVNPLLELPDEVGCLYRLDTATMLTILFGCMLSRPTFAKITIDRVIDLYKELNYVLGEKNAV